MTPEQVELEIKYLKELSDIQSTRLNAMDKMARLISEQRKVDFTLVEAAGPIMTRLDKECQKNEAQIKVLAVAFEEMKELLKKQIDLNRALHDLVSTSGIDVSHLKVV